MRPLLLATVLLVARVPSAAAQNVPPPQVPGAQAPAAQDYGFPSGAGLLFFYVHPDRTADFEAVVKRLGELLGQSADPVRKQQASSWRIYRSLEAPGPSVVYIFFFDPAVAGADYDPVKVLGEAPAGEVQTLYDRLKASIVRVERMGLSKIR